MLQSFPSPVCLTPQVIQCFVLSTVAALATTKKLRPAKCMLLSFSRLDPMYQHTTKGLTTLPNCHRIAEWSWCSHPSIRETAPMLGETRSLSGSLTAMTCPKLLVKQTMKIMKDLSPHCFSRGLPATLYSTATGSRSSVQNISWRKVTQPWSPRRTSGGLRCVQYCSSGKNYCVEQHDLSIPREWIWATKTAHWSPGRIASAC